MSQNHSNHAKTGHYSWILNKIKPLLRGYAILEETGSIFGNDSFRIDGLLVPVRSTAHCMGRSSRIDFFKRPCVVGLEIKTSRNDFLRGLREQQFERYAEYMHGVYVVTPKDVCKTKELPPSVGHITYSFRKHGAVCRRHPKYVEKDLPTDVMWRLLWAVHAAEEKALGRDWKYRRDYEKQMGERIAKMLISPIKQLSQAVQDDLEEPMWRKNESV